MGSSAAELARVKCQCQRACSKLKLGYLGCKAAKRSASGNASNACKRERFVHGKSHGLGQTHTCDMRHATTRSCSHSQWHTHTQLLLTHTRAHNQSMLWLVGSAVGRLGLVGWVSLFGWSHSRAGFFPSAWKRARSPFLPLTQNDPNGASRAVFQERRPNGSFSFFFVFSRLEIDQGGSN